MASKSNSRIVPFSIGGSMAPAPVAGCVKVGPLGTNASAFTPAGATFPTPPKRARKVSAHPSHKATTSTSHAAQPSKSNTGTKPGSYRSMMGM